ncbi:MAG: hypothetical protein WDW36_007953 [Sanguina aurantia]
MPGTLLLLMLLLACSNTFLCRSLGWESASALPALALALADEVWWCTWEAGLLCGGGVSVGGCCGDWRSGKAEERLKAEGPNASRVEGWQVLGMAADAPFVEFLGDLAEHRRLLLLPDVADLYGSAWCESLVGQCDVTKGATGSAATEQYQTEQLKVSLKRRFKREIELETDRRAKWRRRDRRGAATSPARQASTAGLPLLWVFRQEGIDPRGSRRTTFNPAAVARTRCRAAACSGGGAGRLVRSRCQWRILPKSARSAGTASSAMRSAGSPRCGTSISAASGVVRGLRRLLLAIVRDLRVVFVLLARQLAAAPRAALLGRRADGSRAKRGDLRADRAAPRHQAAIEVGGAGGPGVSVSRIRTAIKGHQPGCWIRAAIGNRREAMGKIETALANRLGTENMPCAIIARHELRYVGARRARVVHAPLYATAASPRVRRFIAIPKANGYQSLHTVLLGPFGAPIEVQIRTAEMDSVAERGVAAHWAYKTKAATATSNSRRRSPGCASLADSSANTSSSAEFIEAVKIDLFPDEVYLFTPRGDILSLPRNATALDFAYAVHTDVGDHAVAARVDKKPHRAAHIRAVSPAQLVEIITAPSAMPNPGWLESVVTGKARTAIRQYLKHLQHEDAVDFGHRMLDRALDAMGSSLDGIPTAHVHEKIRITGAERGVLSFANCCHPLPGDDIVGYLSSGKGIVVHREECPNVVELRKSPERCVAIEWATWNARLGHDIDHLDSPRAPASDGLPHVSVEARQARPGSRPPSRTPKPSRRGWLVPLLLLLLIALGATLWLNQGSLRGLVHQTELNDVLTRAQQALQAGHLDGQDGTSARELFQQAADQQPDNDRAQDGLRQVGQAELAQADASLQGGHVDQAAQQASAARELLGGGTDIDRDADHQGLLLLPSLLHGGQPGLWYGDATCRPATSSTRRSRHLPRGRCMARRAPARCIAVRRQVRQVLQSDPGNAVALHGLDQVSDALAAQARKAFEANDMASANATVEQLAALQPNNGALPALRALQAQNIKQDNGALDNELKRGMDALRAGHIAGDGDDTAMAHFKAALGCDPIR